MKATTTSELFARAVDKHQSGELAEAESLYQRILMADANHGGALFNLSRIAHQFRHHHVAMELLQRFVTVAPGSPDGHYRLGLVHHELQEYEPAIESCSRALQLNPDHQDASLCLTAARKDLALASDPDYAAFARAPWSDTEPTWMETNDSTTLFVLFAGLGVGDNLPTFIFHKFLQRYVNVDKLFVRDLTGMWYQGGIPGAASDVESSAAYLRQMMNGYDTTVFLGCSAGAMAAILFGELTSPSRVIAFAPQSVLSEEKEKNIGDYRWFGRIREIRERWSESPYLDLASLCPLKSSIDIHFPRDERFDRRHAKRLHGPHVRHVEHDTDSHVLAMELRDRGELAAIVEAELSGTGK